MRWLKFNAVGAMGMAVQIATLSVGVHLLELHYILATMLSVEATLLHNFVWHVTWTWPSHNNEQRSQLRALLRFHLITGTVSMAGNTGLMWVLVGTAQMQPVLASLVSIGACSIVNFVVCERVVFGSHPASGSLRPHGSARTGFDIGGIAMSRFRARWKRACIYLCLGVSALVGPLTPLEAQGLRSDTIQAWKDYVLLTEGRIRKELHSDGGFLVQEFQAATEARAERAAVLSGRLLVLKMRTTLPDGTDIKVPGGMIHHWRGVVFIPGTTLEGTLAMVQNPDADAQEDVLEARVLERNGNFLRLFLKLVRSKIVTATYNTEHLVLYRRHGRGQASSRTIATRIAELQDAGTPEEREKLPGRDRGFLWRLNSYWRYQEVEGGVLVECESLTLSRKIPALVSLFVRPIVEGVAKESMNRTLRSMRERLRDAG